MATKTRVKDKVKTKTKLPKNYKVLLLNDDVTSMDFVVEVLMSIFAHEKIKAVEIMLKVHNEGSAVCGVYPYEIAETKVEQVYSFAKSNNFPLRAVFEEE